MSFENLKSARGSSIDQLVKAAGAVSEKSGAVPTADGAADVNSTAAGSRAQSC